MKILHRIRLVACFLLLVVLSLSPLYSWGQTSDRIGTVLVVEGVAEVQAQDATEWERLRFRDALLLNDTVRTAANSKVKVLLRDDSILTLAERSEMEFTEFVLTQQQRRSIVSLFLGTLKVITTRLLRPGSVAEVRTPNAVAGVRGTTFIVTFIPPDTTETIVIEGLVTAQNLDPAIPNEESVPQNFRTRVTGATAPAKATEVSPQELQTIEQTLQITAQVPTETLPTGAVTLEPVASPRGASQEQTPSTGGTGQTTTSPTGGEKQPTSDAIVVPPVTPVTTVAAITAAASVPEAGAAGVSGVSVDPQVEIITPDTSPAAEEIIRESLLRLTIRIPR